MKYAEMFADYISYECRRGPTCPILRYKDMRCPFGTGFDCTKATPAAWLQIITDETRNTEWALCEKPHG